MKRQLLVLVAIAALAVLLFPTAAGPFTGDADTGVVDVSIAPSEGPNGVYAVLEDGEISLDLSESNQALAGEGIRDNAVTELDDVFTLTYTGESEQAAIVWLTHEGDGETLQFYRNDNPDRLLQSRENSVELGTNETARVGLRIDTTVPDHDVESIESFTIRAELPEQETPTETPQIPEPPQQPTETPTAIQPTPTQTPTATPPTPTQTPTATPPTPTQTPTATPPTPTQTPTDSQTSTGGPTGPTQTPTDTPIDGELTGIDDPGDGGEDTEEGLGDVFVGALSDTFLLLLLALIVGVALFLLIGSRRDEDEDEG